MRISLAVAFVFISLSHHALADSSVCLSTIMSLAPCLQYLNGKSSSPSEPCCSKFDIVLKEHPECLCTLFNGEASKYGLTINQTQALTLPDACGVKTPPVSECKGVSIGAGKFPAAATPTPSTPSANSPAPATAKAKPPTPNAAAPTTKATAPTAKAAAPTTTPTVSDAKPPAGEGSHTADKSSDGVSYKSTLPMVVSAVFFAVFGSSLAF